MTEKPTLSSVAKAAGVSIPTVSQVMRGTGRISEETRERVQTAAKKLRYIPNSRAAAMRSGENREIGFVLNHIGNPFNAEVISGVVDHLETKGYLVSVVDTRDDCSRQGRLIETFIRHGRGGLLWVPAFNTAEDTFELLSAQKIPVVTFLRNARESFDHVGIRNAEATATATAHLGDLGHRQIAYLGGTEMTEVRKDRIRGYTQVMQREGYGLSVVWDCEDNKLAGLEAMLQLRQTHPEVTAIICNGDMVALGACLALARLGMTPGREVSVIGFDNIQDAAVAAPPLTTIRVWPEKLGKTLAQVLLDRIHEPDQARIVSESKADLIVRQTTGRLMA